MGMMRPARRLPVERTGLVRRLRSARTARMTRREFLRRSGQAAIGLGIASQLGWQIGCGDGSSSGSSGPSEAAWRELAASLQGMLLRPGNPTYAQTGLPSNLAYTSIRPQGIALCAGAADVQTSVRWARDNGLPAVPRSGGHNYAGYSTTTGLLVDLSLMDTIEIDRDAGVVDLGAGALLGPIDDAAGALAVTVSGGRCIPVGIGGLVLGGGIGFNARSFGLTCDTLLQTRIVTADAELLTCSESEHPDLFWAVRGGGGGNFGINVDFGLRVFPVTTASVYCLEWDDPDDFAAAWSAMQDIAFAAPDAFSMILAVAIDENGPLDGARNQLVQAIGQLIGPQAELRDLLAPAFAAAEPSTSTIEELSFADATVFLQQQGNPDAFLSKSAYLAAPLPDAGVATLLDWIPRFPPASRAADFAIFTWGGAISRVPPDATAFANRSGAFVIEGDSSWHPDDPQSIVDASKDWIQGLFADLQPYFSGAAYQNFIDPTQSDWQHAYYGANFPRLVQVKSTYDPTNFFRFAQSIPTAL
jgi:FAD/FMN-containing dehydrogenase